MLDPAMIALAGHAARVLLDASTANGGAIDGFLWPFTQVEALVLLLALGFAAAQHIGARPVVIHATMTAATILAAVLGAHGIGAQQSPAAVVLIAVLVVGAALAGPRLPWWVGSAAGALLAALLIGPACADAGLRGSDYSGSFGASAAATTMGIAWVGTALGFMALRSRRGLLVARVMTGVALVATVTLAVGARSV